MQTNYIFFYLLLLILTITEVLSWSFKYCTGFSIIHYLHLKNVLCLSLDLPTVFENTLELTGIIHEAIISHLLFKLGIFELNTFK